VNDKPKNPVGRPPIANPATKQIKVKVTPEQHARFISLGGSRWVKEMLDKLKGK